MLFAVTEKLAMRKRTASSPSDGDAASYTCVCVSACLFTQIVDAMFLVLLRWA
jgi:hypothetical protein